MFMCVDLNDKENRNNCRCLLFSRKTAKMKFASNAFSSVDMANDNNSLVNGKKLKRVKSFGIFCLHSLAGETVSK